MKVNRTPKVCLHKVADHQHGTHACYALDGCRCLPCCHAASVYELDRKKRNAYGRSNLVDATPVREHVAALMAVGVGLKRIASVSGVPQGGLWKLMYGKKRADGTMVPSRRVTKPTAEKLLALDPADPSLLADGAKVDPTGTARRLQALARLGWSVNRLAMDSGTDRQRLDQAMRGGTIVASTARTVANLYERLWDKPAPATDHRERISVSRTINRATTDGWLPPLAWDDDTIDDPTAGPAPQDEPSTGEPGRRRDLEREEKVGELTRAGLSAVEIANRLGTNDRYVTRVRARQREQAVAA